MSVTMFLGLAEMQVNAGETQLRPAPNDRWRGQARHPRLFDITPGRAYFSERSR